MNKVVSFGKFKSLLMKPKQTLYIHEYQAYDLLKKYHLPLVPVIKTINIRASGQAPLKMHIQ